MNVDSSVYDVNIEFGKLNCGDTFIYLALLRNRLGYKEI